MLAGLLITIREGTEAFLLVGILLGYLVKIGQPGLKKHIWLGTIAALILSGGLAWTFSAFAVQFEGTSAQIFEIVVALIAVAVLTYMVLWMQQQSRNFSQEMGKKVDAALSANKVLALAGLAFVSVLREGLETALFLTALTSSGGQEGIMPGAFLGLVVAAVIGYIVFKTTVRLNLKRFFVATGFLVIFIAAGLIGHIIAVSGELGLVPQIISQVWDTNAIINEDGLIGRLLHAFIGYDANPSLMFILGYAAYIVYFGRRFWVGGSHAN